MKKLISFFLIFGICTGIFAQDKEKKDYEYPPFQVTFFPPLGTNGMHCGNVVNKLSFNIIAGYAAGLTGIEIGGFANVEKDFVHGVQIAGFANLVGKDVAGLQIAGFANVAGGYAHGSQISGFANLSKDHKGLQLAGFSNLAIGNVSGNQISGFSNLGLGDLIGMQLAGFSNLTLGSVTGTQISGFASVSNGKTAGTQISGFSNISTRGLKGIQISGFSNVVVGNVKGVQISGFANVGTGNLKGSQISGFVNYAQDIKGIQLGFVNISRSAEKGVPIGFISVVKNGLKQIEISGGEAINTSIAYKTGVKHFYNIFALGANFKDEKFRWGPGYGIGSLFDITSSLDAGIELMSYHIIEEWAGSWRRFWRRNNLNLLNQAKLNISYNIGSKFSIFAGGSFNVMVSEYSQSGSDEIGSDIAPWYVYDRTRRNTNVKMWPGFNFGVRLHM